MRRRTLATLGSGALAAGHVGAVVALVGRPLRTVAVTGLAAACLGLVVGSRVLTDERLAAFAERKRLMLLSALSLLGLVGLASWDGFVAELGGQYATAMGAIYLALVGWVTVLQVGQNAESDAARERGATLLTLPETDLVGIVGVERYRQTMRLLGWAVGALLVGWFGWLAVVESNPLFLVFTVPVAATFLPGMTFTVHVTEEGLVSENTLGSSVPIGTKFTSWDEISGYEVGDETLTIATALGPNFTYEIGDFDDLERVRSVLDEYAVER
ncbi:MULTISPECIES: hypothetical protein [Haloarcula]|uniref:hypothetical protein n=1 Tax=Haloarcula TaxID=2237 RepID=UPI0023E8B9FE|nr:hypothetical protein [Halomicroarcula sp. SHR3]